MIGQRHPNTSVASVSSALVFSEGDLVDFARGAAFLGTGGGGDPYIGRLMAENAIQKYGHPSIVSPSALSDDATVCFVAMLGAPTVLVEKAVAGDDLERAISHLAERLGRPIDALMPVEIGGINSTLPIVAAARLGLPLLNADGMGRAFPAIQMVVMNFEGVHATPFVIVDEHLNTVTVETDTADRAEAFVRVVATQMGMSCVVSGYPMTGKQVKAATIHNTLTEALEIGRAVALGRQQGNPVQALLDRLSRSEIYGYAREIFDGKIVDVHRRTEGGFTIGSCAIEDLSDVTRQMHIDFQNENLIAKEGDRVRASVPDLITIIDRETADPIPTESLKYGQRVKVIAVAAPKLLTTPTALEHVGPRAFGTDHDFVPIQQLTE
ncbi:MAG: DUF917 domain-containing protein [Pseudomonadota bacterium]